VSSMVDWGRKLLVLKATIVIIIIIIILYLSPVKTTRLKECDYSMACRFTRFFFWWWLRISMILKNVICLKKLTLRIMMWHYIPKVAGVIDYKF